MPQVCSVKVLVFLVDRRITHQELYASAASKEVERVGERFVRHPKAVYLDSPCTK